MAMVKKLIEGYKEFISENKDPFKGIKTSQSPDTFVIGCCDSRVDPAILTKANVGDIFIHRNIANMVPTCEDKDGTYHHGTSSAIEYAVNHLMVKNIIVLGHTNCGGIKALVDRTFDKNEENSFIKGWIDIMSDVRNNLPESDSESKYCSCEKASIKRSIENLMTFPFVKEAVEAGRLELHGWYFNIEDSSLSALDKETSKFKKI